MRVLHVVPSLYVETGGPARSVPLLCRALQAVGVDVTLYTFRRSGAETSVSQDTETFPIEWFVPAPGSSQFPTVAFYQSLRQGLRQFDLVHLHSLWNPAISVAALACRQVGVPYLLSPRGMLQDGALHRKQGLKTLYFWLLERRTLASVEAIHFFTRAEAEDSRRLLSGRTSTMVIPSGIDPSLVDDVQPGRFRQAYPALEGKRLLLCLGRLHWSKGLALQVQALALLVKAFPNLVWVLVGPDEGEWPHLTRQIASMGLEHHVLWTGILPRQQCLEALADADVFLLTSRHEAHSMAMNEALAVGVPLVITDTVHFDDVQDWGAGYVVPREPQSLAEAIAAILEHPAQAQSMRQAGRHLVVERLALPKVAEAMVKAYEQILAKNTG